MCIYIIQALVRWFCTITSTALPTCTRLHILAGVKLFNNWNIIKFSNGNTKSEDFKDINKVVLDNISENMEFLVKYSNYGAMNTTDTPTLGYYVVKYVSYAYTLNEEDTRDDQISTADELFVLPIFSGDAL